MDDYDISSYNSQVIDCEIEDWHVLEYINHGKSAAVYKAQKNDMFSAIKVFDRNIVKNYGLENQQERVEREKSLIGKHHKSLIDIYGGGYFKQIDLLYVIMQYSPFKNLFDRNSEIKIEHIPNIINQIAEACIFLEKNELAHRDIKLENIVISENLKDVKVLDLGVLHPLKSEYDHEKSMAFIATRRASPPELLFREEEQTTEAWRAITFYQIGVVLYELLLKKFIFLEYETPDARLCRAIERVTPSFVGLNNQSDPLCRALMVLCKQSLLKNPQDRLKKLTWDDFTNIEVKHDTVSLAKAIKHLQESKRTYSDDSCKNYETQKKRDEYAEIFHDKVHNLCVGNANVFPQKIFHQESHDIATFSLTVSFDGINKSITLKAVLSVDLESMNVSFSRDTEEKLIGEYAIEDSELYSEIYNVLLGHVVEHSDY